VECIGKFARRPPRQFDQVTRSQRRHRPIGGRVEARTVARRVQGVGKSTQEGLGAPSTGVSASGQANPHSPPMLDGPPPVGKSADSTFFRSARIKARMPEVTPDAEAPPASQTGRLGRTVEALRDGWPLYRQLIGYMRPYRTRFFLGLLAGV